MDFLVLPVCDPRWAQIMQPRLVHRLAYLQLTHVVLVNSFARNSTDRANPCTKVVWMQTVADLLQMRCQYPQPSERAIELRLHTCWHGHAVPTDKTLLLIVAGDQQNGKRKA